jgi:hypothetical protein
MDDFNEYIKNNDDKFKYKWLLNKIKSENNRYVYSKPIQIPLEKELVLNDRLKKFLQTFLTPYNHIQ